VSRTIGGRERCHKSRAVDSGDPALVILETYKHVKLQITCRNNIAKAVLLPHWEIKSLPDESNVSRETFFLLFKNTGLCYQVSQPVRKGMKSAVPRDVEPHSF
jgi:hypothetical protein